MAAKYFGMAWATTLQFCGFFDGATGVAIPSHIFCADKGDYYEITGGLPQADADDPALTAQF